MCAWSFIASSTQVLSLATQLDLKVSRPTSLWLGVIRPCMVCNSLNGLDFMQLGEVHELSVWIIEASPSSNLYKLYLTSKVFSTH